jgi:hypothetical protein
MTKLSLSGIVSTVFEVLMLLTSMSKTSYLR